MSKQPARKPSKRLWILVAFLGVLLAAIVWYQPTASLRDSGLTHDAVGQPMPEFELVPLTGNVSSVSLSKLKGEVVLLNLWGTWCGPCQQEFPHLAAVAERFADQQEFRMLSVSCGSGGGYEDVDALRQDTLDFLTAMRSDLPTFCDPDASLRIAMMNSIGFDAYPTTLVLDRQGVVRGYWQGYTSGMERSIESLVATLLVKGKEGARVRG